MNKSGNALDLQSCAGVPDLPDGRTLPREALQQRRVEAADLHRTGMAVTEIARRTGLSRPTVYAAIKTSKAGGDRALAPRPRGRRLGDGRALTATQEAQIRDLLVERRPPGHALQGELWTRLTVQALIVKQFGISLTPRAVGNYLARWGVGVPEPEKSPSERCVPGVQGWLDSHYADLHQRALAEECEIYWLNKVIRLDSAIWSPSTATAEGQGTPRKLYLLSAINNQGKMFWLPVVRLLGAQAHAMFIKWLSKDTKKITTGLVRERRSRMLVLIRHDMASFEGASQALDPALATILPRDLATPPFAAPPPSA